ncbi:MAG: AsmA-like C-terminal region-containing protein [Planctomycetota bacterium]
MKKDDFKELEYRDYAGDLPSGKEQLPTLRIPNPTRLTPEQNAQPIPPRSTPKKSKRRTIRKILAVGFGGFCLFIIFLPKFIPTKGLVKQLEKELKNNLQREIKIESISLGWFGLGINNITIYDRFGSPRLYRGSLTTSQNAPPQPVFTIQHIKIKGWLPGMISKTPSIKEIIITLNDSDGRLRITGDLGRWLGKNLDPLAPQKAGLNPSDGGVNPAKIHISLKELSIPFALLFPEKWPKNLISTPVNGVFNIIVKNEQNVSSEGKLNIAEITFEDLVFKNITVPLKVDNQQMEINSAAAVFNEGTVGLSGTIDFSQKLPALISINAEKVKLSHFCATKILPFLQPLFPDTKEIQPVTAIEGQARVQTVFSLDCNVTLSTPSGWGGQNSLTGAGKITIEHGLIEGSEILKKAAFLLGKEDLVKFEFSRMEQSFEIKNNRIYNQQAEFSGPKITLELSGWTDFQGNIEQRLKIIPVEKYADKNMVEICKIINEAGGIPISGTIAKPKIDTKEIRKKIIEKLKKD